VRIHETTRAWIASVALAAVVAAGAPAQNDLPAPKASPPASVTQTFGLTEVEVTYHRPGVKGRSIWGDLVPYWQVWRAGANENTTIAFSTDVLVEGQPLPAGTYGLHMIPSPDTWEVIFSENATSWGSYFYTEEEDVLRVTVTPERAPHEEWLTYAFDELADDAATLALRWAELRVPVRLTVDLPEVTYRRLRDEHLRNFAGFGWRGWYDAATYLLEHDLHLDEADRWITRSVAMNANFTNQWTAAVIYDRLGRTEEAARARAGAIEAATWQERDALADKYMAGDRLDEAIGLLEMNVEKHPDSWRVHERLASALAQDGRTERAREAYRRALELAPGASERSRLSGALEALRG